MFGSIVVGTDGSDTAKEAVRQATELAKALGAEVNVVSAYEPVPEARLRQERKNVPGDIQWSINEREDVEATLNEAADNIRGAGVKVETFPREGDPADAILDVAEEQVESLAYDRVVVNHQAACASHVYRTLPLPRRSVNRGAPGI